MRSPRRPSPPPDPPAIDLFAIASRNGLDWAAVRWGKPEEPRSSSCSSCTAEIPDTCSPLRIFRKTGHGAVFCNGCASKYFGLQSFDDEADSDFFEDAVDEPEHN